MTWLRLLLAAPALAFLLVACAGTGPAPIEDRRTPAQVQNPRETYAVSRGDTLYSIAFRFGLDYRSLARINRIPPPYTIYPGERLLVRGVEDPGPAPPETPPHTPPQTAASGSDSPPAPGQVIVRPAVPTAGGSAPSQTRARTAIIPEAPVSSADDSPGGAPPGGADRAIPDGTTPKDTQVAEVRPTADPPAATSPAPTARPSPPPAPSGPVSRWQWPAAGPVTRGFSSSVHKGVDIGGQRGDAVRAAAAGQVVYAGTGIVGFGELLIIKHDDTHLSAYGHNARLLVREGDTVAAGQQIAEKGSSGTDTVKLHFEIRRAGKPVDPLGLLPRR